MKMTVLFQCGFIKNCPTCGQEDPDTACAGSKRVEVEAPSSGATNGYLMAAAGGRPECPKCGEYMVMTDRYESPEETGKVSK